MSTYEISKSSLLSLKAEILRKQEEVIKTKLETKHKPPPNKSSPLDFKGIKKHKQIDKGCSELNSDDEDLLRKSRQALESKSKLYDQLIKEANEKDDEDDSHKQYLVHFKKKLNQELLVPQTQDPDSSRDEHQEEYEDPNCSDEEWVEYTDCLGRTRTCLRKDLQVFKAKDAQLKSKVEDGTEQKDKNLETNENTDDNVGPEIELLSSDMRREQLRSQWEKEEEELARKNNIHYQDILFNEARSHGVGYYGFSKDEEERARQQDALRKLRKETEDQQKRAQDLKATRAKQLAARVKAAKNRQRARLGLPPEEETISNASKEEEIAESIETKEEDVVEKLKEKARKDHIRPWDLGKEGVQIKKHYEYSQEEWVKKQRQERKSEFAPPSSYIKEQETNFRSISKPISNDDLVEENRTLFFTTKTNKLVHKPPKPFISRRNQLEDFDDSNETSTNYNIEDLRDETKSSKHTEPVLIVNECSSDSNEGLDRLMIDYKQINNASESSKIQRGVEIPPPTNMDYYGNSSKRTKSYKRKNDTEDSIMAGLKFLRQQVEKKEKSTSHPSEMFLC